ncbi:MAG: sulfatase-like hydrolase/transferase [Chroococcidiopsidaceae cyanobacterium CP_BM_ER_R8_30]|nr:sulfatase-like hydrolase/transferase [Chroococcidiopsidaceae cyanobacterium CP_BM_ER_R8_30]
MDRRDFIKVTGAATAGTFLAKLLEQQAQATTTPETPVEGPRPNIIIILVDEMRYPTVFPTGITTADEFIASVMPNTYNWLWRDGVKFSNYFTASDACTPARGTIVSGLYAQQSWMLTTRPQTSLQAPSLNRAFPTYGKLLRRLGYETPYIGKWHLSNAPTNGNLTSYLQAYGFDGLTIPDPLGVGTEGYQKDQQTAAQAVDWLSNRTANQPPFCLTVGFVDPHDKEYFWGGTEADLYNSLYQQAGKKQFKSYTPNPAESSPPPLGFPPVPPNWESADTLKNNKPSLQSFQKQLFEQAFGTGVSDDPSVTTFSFVPSQIQFFQVQGYETALAPYAYWSRALDLYALVMQYVDQQIGLVLNAVPEEIRDNTVVVLTSDHGEYGSAHGLQGKSATVYDEALRVPLVVRDFSSRFTQSPEVTRTQLASSVDLLSLLLGLASLGTTNWMTPELQKIYGKRLNLIPLLSDQNASGRPYILHTTDEYVPLIVTGVGTKPHIIGYRTEAEKLGIYSAWKHGTTDIELNSIELEYYDYTTEGGRAETDNLTNSDDPTVQAKIQALLEVVLQQLIPNELQAPLPAFLQPAQDFSRLRYLQYVSLIDSIKSTSDSLVRDIIAGTFGL